MELPQQPRRRQPLPHGREPESLAGNHVATALALRAGGVDVKKSRVVVFDSAAKAMTAMLGGHLDVVAASASVPVPHIEGGTVRIIAVSAPRRLAGVYANAPTWREQGANSAFSSRTCSTTWVCPDDRS